LEDAITTQQLDQREAKACKGSPMALTLTGKEKGVKVRVVADE